MRMGVRRQACLELTWPPCVDGSTGMPAARRRLCEWKRREETESEGKRAIAINRKFSLAVKDEWMDGRMGERAGGGVHVLLQLCLVGNVVDYSAARVLFVERLVDEERGYDRCCRGSDCTRCTQRFTVGDEGTPD